MKAPLGELHRQHEVRLSLPWPPSANNLFVNLGKRRVPSRDYAAWRKEAGWTLQAQRPPKFRGPVAIGIELHAPHARRYDLDNKSKALLDLLVIHEVIPDDNSDRVRELTVKRVDVGAPCTVIVREA